MAKSSPPVPSSLLEGRTHDEVVLAPEIPLPPLGAGPHALLEPWHREIVESAPIIVPLQISQHQHGQPVEASPTRSFALGDVAFLDEETWPSCGRCENPLEMGIQVAPDALRAFGGAGRGFVTLFCFACGIRHRDDSAFVPSGGVATGTHWAQLGGTPLWDQADETPSCNDHGPMRLLLDYEGGQFLDEALHVFICGSADCPRVRFVAEF